MDELRKVCHYAAVFIKLDTIPQRIQTNKELGKI